MKQLMLISAIIFLSSCASTTIPVPVPLLLPPPLELPGISSEEVMCLPDATYTRLVVRDQLQVERRQTLRDIIESTQK